MSASAFACSASRAVPRMLKDFGGVLANGLDTVKAQIEAAPAAAGRASQ